MKTQKTYFFIIIFRRKFLSNYGMYTVQIPFANSLDQYAGNCVSDFFYLGLSFYFMSKIWKL